MRFTVVADYTGSHEEEAHHMWRQVSFRLGTLTVRRAWTALCIGVALFSLWLSAGCQPTAQHTPPAAETPDTATPTAPTAPPATRDAPAPPHEQEAAAVPAPPAEEPPAPPETAEADDTRPPITDANGEWWETHLNAAAADPERLAQLIPDTKDELWALNGVLQITADNAVKAAVHRKLIRWEPDNPWLYRGLAIYLPQQTRTEKLAAIRVWEAGKRVAKAQGHLLQTSVLAILYCKVGEYEKGIAEAREQQVLIPELVKRIPHHQLVYIGLMGPGRIEHYERLLEAQRAAGTVPVSTLPPRVSQRPFTGKSRALHEQR